MEKIIVANDFVKKYVGIHTTIKTYEKQLAELKDGLECATYVYQGTEKITSCVTVSPVTKKTVKAGYENEYNSIQEQIKALQEKAEQLTEKTFSHYMVKVTKAPKGLNK